MSNDHNIVGTYSVVPGEIGSLLYEAQFQNVMSIQGVAQEWLVYAPIEAEEDFWVLMAPTDGPYEQLQEWGDRRIDCPTFLTYNDATNYALNMAQNDVEGN